MGSIPTPPTNNRIMSETRESVVGDIAEASMSGKKWYMSRIIWTNIVASTAILTQLYFGFVIPPEFQLLILSGINLALRKITKEPVIW